MLWHYHEFVCKKLHTHWHTTDVNDSYFLLYFSRKKINQVEESYLQFRTFILSKVIYHSFHRKVSSHSWYKINLHELVKNHSCNCLITKWMETANHVLIWADFETLLFLFLKDFWISFCNQLLFTVVFTRRQRLELAREALELEAKSTFGIRECRIILQRGEGLTEIVQTKG